MVSVVLPIVAVIALAAMSVHANSGPKSVEYGRKFLGALASVTLQIDGLYQLEASCEAHKNATPYASSVQKGQFLMGNCEQMLNNQAGPKPTGPPPSLQSNYSGVYVDYIVQFIFTLTIYSKTTVYNQCIAFVDKNCPPEPTQEALPPTTTNDSENIRLMMVFFIAQFHGKSITEGDGERLYAQLVAACDAKNPTLMAQAMSELIAFCYTPGPAVETTVVPALTTEAEAVTDLLESTTESQKQCGCIDGFSLTLNFIFGECGCSALIEEKKEKLEAGGCWFCEAGKVETDYDVPCDDDFDFFIEIQKASFKKFFVGKGFDKEYQSDVKVCDFHKNQKKCLKQIKKKWDVIAREQVSQCGCSE